MKQAAKALAKPGLDPALVQHCVALAGRRNCNTKASQIAETDVNTMQLSTTLIEAVKAPANTVASSNTAGSSNTVATDR